MPTKCRRKRRNCSGACFRRKLDGLKHCFHRWIHSGDPCPDIRDANQSIVAINILYAVLMVVGHIQSLQAPRRKGFLAEASPSDKRR